MSDAQLIKDFIKILGGVPVEIKREYSPVGREMVVLTLDTGAVVSLIIHSRSKKS